MQKGPTPWPEVLHASKIVSDEEYSAMKHVLPERPTLCDYATFHARALGGFASRLAAAFGWRYVIFVALVYGLNQGVRALATRTCARRHEGSCTASSHPRAFQA
jgi:hypothetical protein